MRPPRDIVTIPIHGIVDLYWMHRPYWLSDRLNKDPQDAVGLRALARLFRSERVRYRRRAAWVLQELVEPPEELLALMAGMLEDDDFGTVYYAITAFTIHPSFFPTASVITARDAALALPNKPNAQGEYPTFMDEIIAALDEELARREGRFVAKAAEQWTDAEKTQAHVELYTDNIGDCERWESLKQTVRVQELAAELARAGFARQGAAWVLERNDLLWIIVPRITQVPKGVIQDLWAILCRMPSRPAEPRHDTIASFSLRGHLGFRRRTAYPETTKEQDDPLIRDVRQHLIPMVDRLTSVADVVRAMVDGELIEFSYVRRYPVAAVMFGWSAARHVGLKDEMRRAEQIITTTDWDRASRRYFARCAKEGADIATRVELMPSGFQAWWKRIRLAR